VTLLLDTTAWLFCPGDRPERYERALASADVVIIDLEDAVAPGAKSFARETLVAAAARLDPSRIIVRVNAPATADGEQDVDALRATHLRTLMVPKVVGPAQLEAISDFDLIALCESAQGILAAPRIARASNCIAVTWGGQDLAVDLGASGTRNPSGQMLPIASHARTAVRYAAAAAGIPAIDTVWIDIDDLAGLAAEARAAADQGFAGKMVIHPRHVAPVKEAFLPTAGQIAAATSIVEASEGSAAGAVASGGQMLDRPVVEQARLILRRAGAGSGIAPERSDP
jgi:citrate lyase subunit beta / citryl-CoA lyase